MKIINQYLEEQKSKFLPSNLIRFLISSKGNSLNNVQLKSIPDISSFHQKTMIEIAKWSKNPGTKIPIDKTMSFIQTMKLSFIFAYRNGDYAAYSFKDNKVYDWNHEVASFNDQSKMGVALSYQKWIVLVSTKKKVDAQ